MEQTCDFTSLLILLLSFLILLILLLSSHRANMRFYLPSLGLSDRLSFVCVATRISIWSPFLTPIQPALYPLKKQNSLNDVVLLILDLYPKGPFFQLWTQAFSNGSEGRVLTASEAKQRFGNRNMYLICA